jgi:hypothetical protein
MKEIPDDLGIVKLNKKFHAGYVYNGLFYDVFCGMFVETDKGPITNKTEVNTHDFCIRCLGKLLSII